MAGFVGYVMITKIDYFLLSLVHLGSIATTITLTYFVQINTLLIGWVAWGILSTTITLLPQKERLDLYNFLKDLFQFLGFVLFPIILIFAIFIFITGIFTGNSEGIDFPDPFELGELLVLLILVIYGTTLPMKFVVDQLRKSGINLVPSVLIFLITVSLGVVIGLLIKGLIDRLV